MAFLDFVAEKDSHCQHEKFYGNYRGVVVDNNDPLKNGRCKINVFGIYDELEEDHLPWATFSDPFMGGLEGFGSTLIPEIDTHVWIFFEGGDVRHPVYFAGAPAMNGEDTPDVPIESRETERETTFYPDDQEGEYPHNKVLKFKSGMTVEFDQTEGAERLRVLHPSGWEMIVNAAGDQHTYTPGDEESTTDGDVTEIFNATTNKTVVGDVTEIFNATTNKTVVGDETNSYDSNVTETIGGNYDATISGDVTNSYESNVAETIGGNYDVTISGNLNIRVDGHTKLSCPTIDLGESSNLEPSVLGDKLATWITTELKPWLDSHHHIGNLGAPTSASRTAPYGPFIAGEGASGGAVYSKKNRNQ